MAKIVSRRYAKALFDICVEDSSIKKVQEDALQIKNLYDTEESFKELINHPGLNGDEKFMVIKNSFGDNLSETLYGFFDVVFTKNRESFIYDILVEFLSLVDEHLGVTVATVVSAYPLSDDKINLIKTKLSNKLNKEVTVIVEEDKSLIGGFVITVDGVLIDTSIKSSIKNLNNQLNKL